MCKVWPRSQPNLNVKKFSYMSIPSTVTLMDRPQHFQSKQNKKRVNNGEFLGIVASTLMRLMSSEFGIYVNTKEKWEASQLKANYLLFFFSSDLVLVLS